MAAQIIVVSNDYAFKFMIKEYLNDIDTPVKIDSVTLVQASNQFRTGLQNIVIIDVDTQRVTDTYLTALMQQFTLFAIIVGKTNFINFSKIGVNSIFTKPNLENDFSVNIFIRGLKEKIKGVVNNSLPARPVISNDLQSAVSRTSTVVVLIASTGGTDALPIVMKELPKNCPPVLVVQHMPAMFTKQFADRLDRICNISVKEASNGDFLKAGQALVAPGDLHTRMVIKNQKLAVECFLSEKMHGVRPAADVLLSSMLNIATCNKVIAVILTGMGVDGAKGMLDLRNRGARTIGQDKASCVVYGMPKAAYDMGAVEFQLPIARIGNKLNDLIVRTGM